MLEVVDQRPHLRVVLAKAAAAGDRAQRIEDHHRARVLGQAGQQGIEVGLGGPKPARPKQQRVIPDPQLLQHLGGVAIALVIGHQDHRPRFLRRPEPEKVLGAEQAAGQGMHQPRLAHLGPATHDREVAAGDAAGDLPGHNGLRHRQPLALIEGAEAIAVALVVGLKDQLADLLQPQGGFELQGCVGLAHAGRAAQAVALAAHQGSDAVLQGIEAAVDRQVHLSPAHPGVEPWREALRGCARQRPLAAGMAPAGSALAAAAACGLHPSRPGGVRRLWRQPAVLPGMEPEGGRADLLTTGAGHLADVPAAAGRGAVGLHQGDRQLAVVAGLLTGLNQAPEDVAVVGVGVAAGHAAGDGGQGGADLLQRPRRPEVLVAQLGQRNPWS